MAGVASQLDERTVAETPGGYLPFLYPSFTLYRSDRKRERSLKTIVEYTVVVEKVSENKKPRLPLPPQLAPPSLIPSHGNHASFGHHSDQSPSQYGATDLTTRPRYHRTPGFHLHIPATSCSTLHFSFSRINFTEDRIKLSTRN